MKLLLTSAGVKNKSIGGALEGLLAKPIKDVKVGFVPTAANAELGHKDWFIQQLTELLELGYKFIDIIDISAPDVDWRGRLKEVDVLVVSGGNTFHLLNQVRKTGFDKWLIENIENKVYVGISAGSILVTPTIAIAPVDDGDKNLCGIKDLAGLHFVDFEVSPHTPEHVSYKANEEYAKTIKNKLYAYDDNTALRIAEGEVEVISEGKWKLYN